MPYSIELERDQFETLLGANSIDHPDPPKEYTTVRYREVADGVRTGRWIIVSVRWTDEDGNPTPNLQVGWPPVAMTQDINEIGEI